MLDRIAHGDLALTPDHVTKALLDSVTGAADRLADGALTFERAELPEAN